MSDTKSSKKKKLMISLPMDGLSDDEIKTKMNLVKEKLEPQGYEVVESFVEVEPKKDVLNVPLWYMSKSLETMSKCDAVYFCKGWNTARGCLIEYQAAMEYDVEIIKEA